MAETKNSQRPHTPQRTCLGCRTIMPKAKLVRLVRRVTGGVQIDERGREPGRGAYLCAYQECWERALKGNRLEYALRGKIGGESRKELLEYGQALPRRR